MYSAACAQRGSNCGLINAAVQLRTNVSALAVDVAHPPRPLRKHCRYPLYLLLSVTILLSFMLFVFHTSLLPPFPTESV